jgi:hypothetical protein
VEHVKLMSAQQAKATHVYKNTKEKLLETNAAISDSYQFYRDEAFVECCVCELYV